MIRVCHAYLSVHYSLVVTCWEMSGLLVLVCDVFLCFVTFPCGILGRVWYLIVAIPDLCLLTYFNVNTSFISNEGGSFYDNDSLWCVHMLPNVSNRQFDLAFKGKGQIYII